VSEALAGVRVDTIGAQAFPTTPDQLRAFVDEEVRCWAEIVEISTIEKRA
jgi:hypothetical protein